MANTGKDMIATWLWANGYTALVGEECGCGLDDLAPCYDSPLLCRPGYAVVCDGSMCDPEFFGCESDATESNPQVCFLDAAQFPDALDDTDYESEVCD